MSAVGLALSQAVIVQRPGRPQECGMTGVRTRGRRPWVQPLHCSQLAGCVWACHFTSLCHGPPLSNENKGQVDTVACLIPI